MSGNYPNMNEGLRPERIEMPKAEPKQKGPETMGQPQFAEAAPEGRRSIGMLKFGAAVLLLIAASVVVWLVKSEKPAEEQEESVKASSAYTATDEYKRQRPIPTIPVEKPKPAPAPEPEPAPAPKAAAPVQPVQPPKQTVIIREVQKPAKAEPKGPSLSDQKLQAPMMGMNERGQAAKPAPANPVQAAIDAYSDGGKLGEMMRSMQLANGTASRLKNRSFTLPKGTFINCVMETAVDTSVPGMTSCRIPENVFSMDGRTLLIEAGSRAFGEYRGGVSRGMDRIFMLWTSILTPEGVEIRLDSPASDSLGRMGVTGEVNHHWWARFGNALLFSIIDDSFQFAMEKASNSDNSINNYDSTDSGMSQFLSDVIRETGQIPPTITMNQGTRVGIFVARHIDLSSVYRVEETEATQP